ncbi:hypothetical protein [Erythrobacter sp. QSSC1-22B]|uniref:hypothetical protein n=1 Tax=Erythrobacter sp. QSSC1-22B TaxID=1860125 RepID=UPI001439BA67|nr:hypothetical protein [Erythrobacter sp. QSSC1-22B]
MHYLIEQADGSPLKNEQDEIHVFASLADAKTWLLPGERVRPLKKETALKPDQAL